MYAIKNNGEFVFIASPAYPSFGKRFAQPEGMWVNIIIYSEFAIKVFI